MKKIYDITRTKRIGGPNGYYYIWILCEHGIDKDGYYQYSKTIADFGNINKKENYQNAKKLKLLLESESE